VKKILVIIPTYNEAENILNIIPEVLKFTDENYEYNVLVVDDSSPDGTAKLVEDFPSNNVYILKREKKGGLGTAYVFGFKYAINNNFDYVFEMDADFSHNPHDLVRLFNACRNEGADLAIGSRYISGVNVVNWPLSRVLMSYSASIYVRLITGMKIKDTTAGFKCYKRNALENILKYSIKSVGYCFQIEMKFIAWKLGYRIVEIPIIFTDRKLGTSKMSGGIFNEAFWGVLRMKIRSFFTRYQISEDTPTDMLLQGK